MEIISTFGFILFIVLTLATCLAPIVLLLGILKYIFIEEDRKFAIQMMLYALVILIIGLGTCSLIDLKHFI